MTETVSVCEIVAGDAAEIALLAEIEARSHLWRDPDFGVVCVSPHAWDAEAIASALSGPRTAGYVLKGDKGVFVGYYVVEAEPEGFLLRRLLVDARYRDTGVGRTALYRLYRKAKNSRTKKLLRAVIREDDARTCRWLAHMGFNSRLLRGVWDERLDGIEFYLAVTAQDDKQEGVKSEPNEEGG